MAAPDPVTEPTAATTTQTGPAPESAIPPTLEQVADLLARYVFAVQQVPENKLLQTGARGLAWAFLERLAPTDPSPIQAPSSATQIDPAASVDPVDTAAPPPPFTIEHIKHLTVILAGTMNVPADKAPWLARKVLDSLAEVEFDFPSPL